MVAMAAMSNEVAQSKPNTPVGVVLADLETEIRLFNDLLNNLEDRIGPALTKEPSEPKDIPMASPGDTSPASDLVLGIRSARMGLCRHNERLQKIINRVEL